MSQDKTSSASSLKIYLRLLAYVRPYRATFAVSILGFVIFASSQPMLATVMKYFVDGLNDPNAQFSVGWASLDALFAGMSLMKAVPLMIVLIALWQGWVPTWATTSSRGFPSGWCTTCGSSCSTAC